MHCEILFQEKEDLLKLLWAHSKAVFEFASLLNMWLAALCLKTNFRCFPNLCSSSLHIVKFILRSLRFSFEEIHSGSLILITLFWVMVWTNIPFDFTLGFLCRCLLDFRPFKEPKEITSGRNHRYFMNWDFSLSFRMA